MKDLFGKQESSRPYRVADQLKKELAKIIQREVKDPRVGMITVTDVEVTKDLSYADVYFTNMLDKGDDAEQTQQEKILTKASGFLRRRVGQEVKLRIVPQLRFRYDRVQTRANALDALIAKALNEDEERAMARGDYDQSPEANATDNTKENKE